MNRDRIIWLLGSLAVVIVIASGVWYYYTQMSVPITSSTAIFSAIRLDKQMAADTASSLKERAYAVTKMGQRYYGTFDSSIASEIFKDEPYKSMYVPGDDALSYRKIFDYASSLYPLALSELYSSNWYANRILTLHRTATSSPEITIALATIQDQFKAADADFARIKQSSPSETEIIPLALLRKAVTIATLSYAGFASSTDAEEAYKDSRAAYRTYRPLAGSDGPVLYNYARFLARTYGDKRVDDIQSLLKPLYTESSYASFSETLFKNTRTTNGRSKRDVQRLAGLDSGFKAYLTSLGWGDGDF